VWARVRRPAGAFWLCLLLLPLIALGLGQLVYGLPPRPATPGQDLAFAWQHLGAYLQANADYALWQLQGPWHAPSWPCRMGEGQCSPRWALLWDLPFIACYAYVLAWWASAAFARRAALRQTDGHAPRGLNRLGWALPLAVGGDLAENLFSFATLTLGSIDATVLGLAASVLMALAAAAKWLGLAGTGLLIAWGWLAPRR
jgi:hypothetical protein